MHSIDDDKKPLFTLTVSEYSQLMRKIIIEEVDKKIMEHRAHSNKSIQATDKCDIEQAIEITRLVKSTLYSKVSKKHIPCLSRGKPLLFSKDQLEMWLKAGRPKTDSITAIEELLKKKQREEHNTSG